MAKPDSRAASMLDEAIHSAASGLYRAKVIDKKTIREYDDLWEPSMNHIDRGTEEAVRRFLTLIAESYDMAGAIVYGSRARGTHRPDSDADVAVLLRGEHQRVMKTTLAMADVAFDVLLETGINISPLPVWLDEWEHPENYSNPTLLRNIAREGVRL